MNPPKPARPYFLPLLVNGILFAAIAAEFMYWWLYDENWGLPALGYSFLIATIGFVWNVIRLFKSTNTKSKWAHATALFLFAAVGVFFFTGIAHFAKFYAS